MRFLVGLLLILAAALATGGARAENRVALVIGISDYAAVPKLPNPVRDARAMADAFRRMGFRTVTVAEDLPRDRFLDALRDFATSASGSDWAVVYYAGHGIEVGGQNFMIPADARLAADRDAQFEAIALEQVLSVVEGAKKLRLVIIDACRDNPFAARLQRTAATRSIGRGLARVEPVGGTLVAYAARDGQVAFDGDGQNSAFVGAILRHIETPGLELNKLFRLVRQEVLVGSASRQEPFVYGSLPPDDFFFVPPPEGAVSASPPVAGPPPAPKPDEAALARSIISELQRVGCYAGPPTAAWTAPAVRRARDAFARQAALQADAPSQSLLSALQRRTDRVCPTACGPREVTRDGQCVAKSCGKGEILSRSGACVTKPVARNDRPSAPAVQRDAVPRANCFVFDGRSYCQ